MICSHCKAERRTSLCSNCGTIHAAEAPPRPKKRGHGSHRMALTSLASTPRPGNGSERRTAADRAAIMAALREHGRLTRDAIEELTGIAIKSVTPRIFELLAEAKVVELAATAPTRSGRPAYLLELADASRPREPHGVAARQARQAQGGLL